MNKIVYLICLLFPLNVWSFTATKEIQKHFPKDGITSLHITNAYGNIVLLPATGDSITVKAMVVADVIEISDTSEIFRYIDPSTVISQKSLRIKTVYDEDLNNAALAGVHYTIYMPDSVNLVINNRYGDLDIFNAFGTKDITLEYGKITCKNLYCPPNSSNTISLTFATLTAEKCDSIHFQLNNASVTLKESRGSVFESSYSVVSIDKAETVNANSSNDNFHLKTVSGFQLAGEQTRVNIGQLLHGMEVELNHGNLQVDAVSPAFSTLNLSLQNAEARIQTAPESSYYLNAALTYGTFVYPANLSATLVEDLHQKTYSGVLGNTETRAQIGIIGYNSTIELK